MWQLEIQLFVNIRLHIYWKLRSTTKRFLANTWKIKANYLRKATYERQEQNAVTPVCYFNCSLLTGILEMGNLLSETVNKLTINLQLKNWFLQKIVIPVLWRLKVIFFWDLLLYSVNRWKQSEHVLLRLKSSFSFILLFIHCNINSDFEVINLLIYITLRNPRALPPSKLVTLKIARWMNRWQCMVVLRGGKIFFASVTRYKLKS